MRATAWGARIAAVALALWAAQAWAQQPGQATLNRPLVLDLPPPADTGKPRFFAPSEPPPAAGCAGVLDCRVRVIGELQHNGAVEVNGALFKW